MKQKVATLSVVIVPVVWALTLTAVAQEKPQIKNVPVASTSRTSGPEMYRAYCAACHGLDGKGGGPAAPALKMPPPDLTLLSKNNGGKFPQLKVQHTLSMETVTPTGRKICSSGATFSAAWRKASNPISSFVFSTG